MLHVGVGPKQLVENKAKNQFFLLKNMLIMDFGARKYNLSNNLV
jgi:hypothetical protein